MERISAARVVEVRPVATPTPWTQGRACGDLWQEGEHLGWFGFMMEQFFIRGAQNTDMVDVVSDSGADMSVLPLCFKDLRTRCRARAF